MVVVQQHATIKLPIPKMSLKKNGYTLIEILVGLTIIGLLFSFGFVSFRDFSRRQALKGVSSSLQGDLRLAQSYAIAGQKPDSVLCDSPDTLSGYYLRIVSSSEYRIEANCSGGTVIIKTHDLPDGVIISTPNPNPILFKILGQGTNILSNQDPVIITLTQSGTNTTTTVTITGGGEIK